MKSYPSLKLATAGPAKFLYVSGDLSVTTTTVVRQAQALSQAAASTCSSLLKDNLGGRFL